MQTVCHRSLHSSSTNFTRRSFTTSRKGVQVRAMANPDKEGLVSASWLKERLGQPGVKVFDGSWYMPVQARNGKEEFKAKRIAGAKFYDMDGISNPNIDLPHMLPSAAAFSVAMDTLGVTADDTVVVYDGMGCFSAPRTWWTFKVFGHKKVYVLEGGLPAWSAIGGDIDTSAVSDDAMMAATVAARAVDKAGNTTVPATKYKANLDTTKVRDIKQMLANIESRTEQVMDARSLGRFIGTEPEPRAGLKGGHIPGARNIPFPTLLEAGGKFKSAEELQAVFSAAGVDLDKPLVGSCGSGLTACILGLAAYKATGGQKLVPVYDGSWSEWGGVEGVPISTEAP